MTGRSQSGQRGREKVDRLSKNKVRGRAWAELLQLLRLPLSLHCNSDERLQSFLFQGQGEKREKKKKKKMGE